MDTIDLYDGLSACSGIQVDMDYFTSENKWRSLKHTITLDVTDLVRVFIAEAEASEAHAEENSFRIRVSSVDIEGNIKSIIV